jgi:hypothetical protein
MPLLLRFDPLAGKGYFRGVGHIKKVRTPQVVIALLIVRVKAGGFDCSAHG